MKWIFEDVVVQLIRSFFYVTEQQKTYSKTFYYWKNVWNLIMELAIEDLKKDNLALVKE